jgi:hypothetical protein
MFPLVETYVYVFRTISYVFNKLRISARDSVGYPEVSIINTCKYNKRKA